MKTEDLIRSYSYFPSTKMHRVAGGSEVFDIRARAATFVQRPEPVEEINALISDWWKFDHTVVTSGFLTAIAGATTKVTKDDDLGFGGRRLGFWGSG
ncbi:hypothetical protein Tco_1148130 [Tanacetum coccineum]